MTKMMKNDRKSTRKISEKKVKNCFFEFSVKPK